MDVRELGKQLGAEEWQLRIMEAAARGARLRYDLRGNLRLHYPSE